MTIRYFEKLEDVPFKIIEVNVSVKLENGEIAEIGLPALKKLLRS